MHIQKPEKEKNGYVALMSAIVITLILLALTFMVSSSGYFARFNALAGENKRVSLGLAESCVNTVLLKLAKDYTYRLKPEEDDVVVDIGTEKCTIRDVTDPPGESNPEPVTIKTKAEFRRSWSNMEVTAMVHNPTVPPPPQCSDGIDNDNNGVKDHPADPGCSLPTDDTESSPACADVVMMLDRTGSIDDEDLEKEKDAADGLVSLYRDNLPSVLYPYIGFGAFGTSRNPDNSTAQILGPLTTNYSALQSQISTLTTANSYTNLGSAISVSQAELGSVSNGRQKVLVFISDGIANRPGSGTGLNQTAMDAALSASDLAKQAHSHIFAIHYGDSSGKNFLASLASGTVPNSGHQPGSANDQASAAAENADGDYFFVSPTSADLEALFLQIGAIVCPAAGSGLPSSAANMTLGSWEEVPAAP